jgi:hypothetical protein
MLVDGKKHQVLHYYDHYKGLSTFDILFSGGALLVNPGLGNPNPTHQFHPPPTLSEPVAPRLVTMIKKNLKVFRAASKHYRHIYHS